MKHSKLSNTVAHITIPPSNIFLVRPSLHGACSLFRQLALGGVKPVWTTVGFAIAVSPIHVLCHVAQPGFIWTLLGLGFLGSALCGRSVAWCVAVLRVFTGCPFALAGSRCSFGCLCFLVSFLSFCFFFLALHWSVASSSKGPSRGRERIKHSPRLLPYG